MNIWCYQQVTQHSVLICIQDQEANRLNRLQRNCWPFGPLASSKTALALWFLTCEHYLWHGTTPTESHSDFELLMQEINRNNIVSIWSLLRLHKKKIEFDPAQFCTIKSTNQQGNLSTKVIRTWRWETKGINSRTMVWEAILVRSCWKVLLWFIRYYTPNLKLTPKYKQYIYWIYQFKEYTPLPSSSEL